MGKGKYPMARTLIYSFSQTIDQLWTACNSANSAAAHEINFVPVLFLHNDSVLANMDKAGVHILLAFSLAESLPPDPVCRELNAIDILTHRRKRRDRVTVK